MAPVGTAFPVFGTAIDTASAWIDTGYVSTDGVEWDFAREVTEIEAMQSLDPIRIMTTKLPKSFKFGLMQSGQEQFALALGGGSWAEQGTAGSGIFEYTPPGISEVVERAAVIEMIDGTITYRWLIKKCQNKEGVQFKYVRDDAATMPVTLSILAAPDGSEPFTIETNDPAMADPTLLAANGNTRTDEDGNVVENGTDYANGETDVVPTEETTRRSKAGAR
jgi:hypothetical protein